MLEGRNHGQTYSRNSGRFNIEKPKGAFILAIMIHNRFFIRIVLFTLIICALCACASRKPKCRTCPKWDDNIQSVQAPYERIH